MRTQADHAEYDWHAGPSDDQVAAETEAARCAELAALEREIGRLSVGQSILDRVAERLATSSRVPTILNLAYNSLVDERMHHEARYRALHAAGAEAAQGGEEAR